MCGRIQRFTCGNYSITLIPVGDYDREFGSFFQWKTKRDGEISATVNRIRNSALAILKILLIWPHFFKRWIRLSIGYIFTY